MRDGSLAERDAAEGDGTAGTGDDSADPDRRRSSLTRRRAIGLAGLAAVGGTGAWLFRPAPVEDSTGWSPAADLPRSRGEMKAAVHDGRIYVPGGSTGLGRSTARTDVYDPGDDTWTAVAPLPVGLTHHATAALDGRAYVIGGNEDIRDPPGRSAFAYDPEADEWRTVTSLPDGRWGHEALAYDGRLYVLGGVTETDADVDTLEYDPATERWERRAPIPSRREHVAAGALDGDLVVVGGRRNGTNRGTAEAYDPAADSRRATAPVPTPRSGLGAAVLGGRLHAVGGEDPSTVGGWATDVHEVYDPDADAWDGAAPVPLPTHGVSLVADEDRLYAVGGAWRQGLWSVTAWSDRTFVYDPTASGSNDPMTSGST